MLDENGYKVYDNIVDLFMDRDGEKKGPTEAGWGFRKWLIEEMTKAHQELGKTEAGRGAPKPQAKAAPAPVKPAMATTKVSDGFTDSGDDDDGYPF